MTNLRTSLLAASSALLTLPAHAQQSQYSFLKTFGSGYTWTAFCEKEPSTPEFCAIVSHTESEPTTSSNHYRSGIVYLIDGKTQTFSFYTSIPPALITESPSTQDLSLVDSSGARANLPLSCQDTQTSYAAKPVAMCNSTSIQPVTGAPIFHSRTSDTLSTHTERKNFTHQFLNPTNRVVNLSWSINGTTLLHTYDVCAFYEAAFATYKHLEKANQPTHGREFLLQQAPGGCGLS